MSAPLTVTIEIPTAYGPEPVRYRWRASPAGNHARAGVRGFVQAYVPSTGETRWTVRADATGADAEAVAALT